MNNLRYLVRRYLVAAWRYRWPAVLFAWLICAAGWTLTFFIPNIYESNARLYVDTNAVLTPLLSGIAVDSNPYAQLEMLQRTLLSHRNLETLISKTDLDLEVHNPRPARRHGRQPHAQHRPETRKHQSLLDHISQHLAHAGRASRPDRLEHFHRE